MSHAIGASSSNALSYLQSLLQHGAAGAKDAKGAKGATAADPLSMFMQAISDGDQSAGPAGAAAPGPKPASGAVRTSFSVDTMSALIAAQAQQSGDAAKPQPPTAGASPIAASA